MYLKVLVVNVRCLVILNLKTKAMPQTYDEYMAMNDYFENHFAKMKEYEFEKKFHERIKEENNLKAKENETNY